MGISKLNPSAAGIPFGNNAGRPANPGIGKLYSNGEAARLELYTQASGWQNIVQEVPGVASITGTYSEQTDSGTITIAGTNFVSGAIASAIGTNGVEVLASSTTYNSLVQLTAVFTGLSNANEPYDIKVTNPSNLFGMIPDALYVNASPVWQTASGSLGTFNEQVSITLSALSATDSDSATITYALASGSSLPSGVTLNSSTGVISGILPDISTNTTYSFVINASDGLNVIPRTFSITSNYLVPAEYLVVAGGGGGAGRHAGGGGAGGMRYGTLSLLPGSTHTITVGLGGSGAASNEGSAIAYNGANSIFSSITSLGGGRGGDNATVPAVGGSGGGGNGGANNTGATGTSGQGNGGGTGGGGYAGGGGGGAGSSGNSQVGGVAGNGGNGLANSITGVSVTYAGGGGGGGWSGNNFGYGGTGGGGSGSGTNGTDNSATQGVKARNGTDGLGGGGGGGGIQTGPDGGGGAGGSGVVIIAYPSNLPSIAIIPGTLTYTLDTTTRSGYRVYRFTAGTGTITF